MGIQGQQQKTRTHQQQPDRKFQPHAKCRGLRADQPCQNDACDHHRHRIHRLEQRRWHLKTQPVTIHKAIDKQANRTATLLGQHPEQRPGQHQQNDLPQRASVLRKRKHNARHNSGGDSAHQHQQITSRIVFQQQGKQQRRDAQCQQQPAPDRKGKFNRSQRRAINMLRMAKMAMTANKHHQANEHANACQRKAGMPAVPLRRQPAGDGGRDGADIPGCVEQGKSAVASGIVRGVKLAQQTANIGFKQAVATDNNRQREIQTLRGI